MILGLTLVHPLLEISMTRTTANECEEFRFAQGGVSRRTSASTRRAQRTPKLRALASVHSVLLGRRKDLAILENLAILATFWERSGCFLDGAVQSGTYDPESKAQKSCALER